MSGVSINFKFRHQTAVRPDFFLVASLIYRYVPLQNVNDANVAPLTKLLH
jgi:hypothetical protein